MVAATASRSVYELAFAHIYTYVTDVVAVAEANYVSRLELVHTDICSCFSLPVGSAGEVYANLPYTYFTKTEQSKPAGDEPPYT